MTNSLPHGWLSALVKRRMDELENAPPVPEEHNHIFGNLDGTVSKSKWKDLEEKRDRVIGKQTHHELLGERLAKTEEHLVELEKLNENRRSSRLREISSEIRLKEDVEFETFLKEKPTKH